MDYDGLTNIVDVYIRHLAQQDRDASSRSSSRPCAHRYMIEAPDKPAERTPSMRPIGRCDVPRNRDLRRLSAAAFPPDASYALFFAVLLMAVAASFASALERARTRFGTTSTSNGRP